MRDLLSHYGGMVVLDDYPRRVRSQAHEARLLRIRLGRYEHVLWRPGHYPLPSRRPGR